MNELGGKKKAFSPRSLKWLRIAVELLWKIRLRDRHMIYIWAIVVGVLGAGVALCFEYAVELMQWVFTGAMSGNRVEVFLGLPEWGRIFVPVIGGVLAGSTLLYIHRFVPVKSTEYMEALSVGNGIIPARSSLMQSLSAIFSIASGAAIGREGPLVQSSAVVASFFGQKLRLSAPRLRLLVGCGAAAGIAAAFHAPLGACLFVCEIVLGTLALDLMVPLLISGSTSFIVMHFLGKQRPIYEASYVDFGELKQIFLCMLLGIIAAVVAKLWLYLLKLSRKYLNGKRKWLPIRLALAGMFVGGIACYYPEVVGNGAEIISGLIHNAFTPQQSLILLGVKILAVVVVFGCGTVGGALTPSLTVGGLLGFLFSYALNYLGILEGDTAVAFTMIGMAAFFSTAANAPFTSLILVLEFTVAGNMIFPLMVAVVCSYGMSRILNTKSMYYDSVRSGPRSAFDKPLGKVRLSDIARKSPPAVEPGDKFGRIASLILRNPGQDIFVITPEGDYLGIILSDDVGSYAKTDSLADAIIAMDVMRQDVPVLRSNMALPDALKLFTDKKVESMPLLLDDTRQVRGVINRNDLYQVITEVIKRETIKQE